MFFFSRNKKQTNQMVDNDKKPPGATASLTREVAGVAGDLHEPLAAYLGVRPNRDPLLAAQQPDHAYAYPYGLFEEALDKDAHLAAIVAQRKAAVLAWERRVEPADSSPEAAQAAALVEAALRGIGGAGQAGDSANGAGGFERDLSELLDAIPYGFAVSEVVWERRALEPAPGHRAGEDTADPAAAPLAGNEWLLPARLLSRHPRRFIFGVDGTPRLLTAAEPVRGEELPPRKFLVFAPYGRHEDPYGLPLLRSVWWLAYFKRQVLRFWVMYCEKFGTPTAVLKHPLGATERERAAYRRIVGSLQQETGLVVPEGVELSLLEPERAGSVETYRSLIELCNAEMSKAVLGQTLTTDNSGVGSYALGRVHQAVREDIVRADAQALGAILTGQLARWIVVLNFPPALRRFPRLTLAPPRADDLALQLEVDRFFQEAGLSLDAAELYARYRRTQPVAPDASAMATLPATQATQSSATAALTTSEPATRSVGAEKGGAA